MSKISQLFLKRRGRAEYYRGSVRASHPAAPGSNLNTADSFTSWFLERIAPRACPFQQGTGTPQNSAERFPYGAECTLSNPINTSGKTGTPLRSNSL